MRAHSATDNSVFNTQYERVFKYRKVPIVAGNIERICQICSRSRMSDAGQGCGSAGGVCARTKIASCKTFDENVTGCATSWARWSDLSLVVCWSAQALRGSYGLLPHSTIRHVTLSLASQQCRVSRAARSAPRPHGQVHRTTRYAPVRRPGLRRLFPHGTKEMMLCRTPRCAVKTQSTTWCQE
jgi:hypothetical protein